MFMFPETKRTRYLFIDKSKRFIDDDNKVSQDKLIFLKSIALVIKSGMNILGVETPEKM